METKFRLGGAGLIAGALALLLLAGGGLFFWMQAQDDELRESILVVLPGRPEPARLEPALVSAIDSAYREIEKGEDPVRGLERLTLLYQANGFLNEAIQGHDLLLQLQPEDPRWPHLLAFILAGYGQLEVALPLWEQVIALDPDYLPAHLRRAEALLKLNRPDDAREAYVIVQIKDPLNPYAFLGLARVAINRGDYRSARRYLLEAMGNSSNRIGGDLLVTVFDRLGEKEKADYLRGQAKASGAYTDIPDPWLNALMDYCYDPFQLVGGGGFAAFSGDAERGIRLVKRALQYDPDNVSAYFQLGNLYRDTGETTEAMLMYERAAELNPQLADAWLFRANLLLDVGEEVKGEELLALGLAHNPDSPALHLAWGERLLEKKQLEQAMREFKRSIELRPQEPEAYIALAMVYFQQERIEEGRAQLLASLDAEAANPVALATLAMIAISSGHEKEAREWMQAVDRQPRILEEHRQDLVRRFKETFGDDPY